MNQVERIRIFLRVAELESFSGAAEALGLPRATISEAVARLEKEIGARLLHRTTRRVHLSQEGDLFAKRAVGVLADLDELGGLFQESDAPLRGRLRIDMPVGAAREMVIPRLGEFLAAHPLVEIELSSTDRYVDVIREGFDLVLRVGPTPDSTLMVKHLGYYRMVNCASPKYLAKFGRPTQADDLALHHLIHYAPTFGGSSDGFEYLDADGNPNEIAMSGRLTVNSSQAYVAGAVHGLGIIQIPEVGVREELRAGTLVEILPDFRPQGVRVSLLYPHGNHLPRRVNAFMTWMIGVLTPFLVTKRQK